MKSLHPIQITIKSPEPSDPRSGLQTLAESTAKLREQNDKLERLMKKSLTTA